MSPGAIIYCREGVTVCIDRETEEQWMDLDPAFQPSSVLHALRLVNTMGYEAMDELEGVEQRPDGTIRQWLAVKERGEMTKAS